MRKKYIGLLLLLLFAMVFPIACASEEVESKPIDEEAMMELTLDELAQYNGKDGNPAYVAVDGVIYDVSNVPAWAGGIHNGNMAGQDVTAVMKEKSPHGTSPLEKLPVVGNIVE